MMTRPIKRFRRDETAAVAFEAVIMTPILAWLLVGSFVFFDAFRTYNTSLKATYAVADVLSRSNEETLYGSDIEGLAGVFQHISRNTAGSSIRVTEISWDGTGHGVEWSHPTGGNTRVRDSDLPDLVDRLPIMAAGERVLLVETFLPYDPFFDIGLSEIEFTNFTVTRPRFAGQLDFDDGIDPTCTSCNVDDGSLDGTDDGTDEPSPGGGS